MRGKINPLEKSAWFARKFIMLLVLLAANPLQADEPAATVWENIKSPLTTNARYVLYTGAAITLTFLAFDKQLVDESQREVTEHKILGETSIYGDQLGQLYPNIAYTFGMLAYGGITGNKSGYRDASLMFQSTTYASVATNILKYTIRQPRPKDPRRRDSFPSGHATTIFAFASYIGCRHSAFWGVAAYALAGFVGYSRINDNAHFAHDVTGGATIGISYGLGACLADQQAKGKSLEPKTIGYAAPIENGLVLGVTREF